jgi:hypothetical protein
MTKTLEEAIGCWTTNLEYNSLVVMARRISMSATLCRKHTMANKPNQLKLELHILHQRLDAMLALTLQATDRLYQIIGTNELEK